ncbi:MAG: prolyl oligopeptidase family serine peptidase, partial [Planctomycetales bacterium]|nr:prolyl oligopeptidase family serine peptidase [Planctomycetales bacterium]
MSFRNRLTRRADNTKRRVMSRQVYWLSVMFVLACHCALPCEVRADGVGDNNPATVRPVPAPGVKPSPQIRERLTNACDALDRRIRALQSSDSPHVTDVQVFSNAVRSALEHNEFFDEKEFASAEMLLIEGAKRAAQLEAGQVEWSNETGLVVRGYRSKIDHSIQPYGLVIAKAPPGTKYRLDVWFHGRGEKLSEVNFLAERLRQPGQFTPAGTIVLHPYGRYCNAFKFAGEVDVLEAIEAVQREFPIDEERISVRGFSMGGAACWQFAVHYADRWFAANPGAGFSETPEFLASFQQEELKPTWYERKLWRWYDCPGYAINLLHCPTIAYSGELDTQKQAADVMQAALAKEDIDLLHIIGPQTKHSIHPTSKIEIERRLKELSINGRERVPRHVELTTFTLKYPRMHWIQIDALGEHWEPAHVTADLQKDARIDLKTSNVSSLTLDFPAGHWPDDVRLPVNISIDEQALATHRPQSDRSWR